MTPWKVKRFMSSRRPHKSIKALRAVTKSVMASKKARTPIMAPTKVTKSFISPTEANKTVITHEKPDATSSQTAAQRALSVPEVLAQIFEAIAKRWGQKWTVLETGASVYQLRLYARKALTRCARVNKMWFSEATRLLWQYPDFRCNNNLSRLLRHVSPERMEIYADSVQLGFIAPLSLNGLLDANNSLDGVQFSRIRLLRLHLWSQEAKDFLPLIQAPVLEVLEIDPHSLLYKPYINQRIGVELAMRCQVGFSSMFFVWPVMLALTPVTNAWLCLDTVSKSSQDSLHSVRLHQQRDEEPFCYVSSWSSGCLEWKQRVELAQGLAQETDYCYEVVCAHLRGFSDAALFSEVFVRTPNDFLETYLAREDILDATGSPKILGHKI